MFDKLFSIRATVTKSRRKGNVHRPETLYCSVATLLVGTLRVDCRPPGSYPETGLEEVMTRVLQFDRIDPFSRDHSLGTVRHPILARPKFSVTHLLDPAGHFRHLIE
jgi:hypothetical protein